MNNVFKSLKYAKVALGVCITVLLAACGGSDPDTPDTPEVPGGGQSAAQIELPRKELRGVWMATVWGIDWPQGKYDMTAQKALYTKYLDLFAENNINAVFVQVRGMADAFYNSPYEPWSKNITNVAGKDPGYDVMKFMIDEAHKRGIAFHAWINPYRIATRAGGDQSFPKLDAKIPAAMTKDYAKIRVYNPALPEVRQRIVSIVKDLVTKYEVDGVHMDDYFYPSLEAGESMNDAAEYEKYGKGQFDNIADFRRDNVNQVVKGLHDMIQATRSDVVFSISPAANYNNNYNLLYADVTKWSQEGWTEMIIPQIYFATGTGATNFNQYLTWWSQYTYKNALMVGYGLYRFGDPTQSAAFQSSADLQAQFDYAATKRKVQGSVLYSARDLMNNKVDIMSVIKRVYKDPALPPYLGKQEAKAPAAVSSLKATGRNLTWNAMSNAYYAVYRSNGTGKTATLVKITREPSATVSAAGSYFVTAVDKRNNAESKPSALVEVK